MIRAEKLNIRQGDFSLADVNLRVPTGSYAALVGKSGSGKTTLLEAICGLRPVASGRILLGDRDVTHLKPGERSLGYVPQDGALFPHLTVAEQLGFALEIRKEKPETIDARIRELADHLDITPLLPRLPDDLSGGERQRVALGRALSTRPSILCLDEPLAALDPDTHEDVCSLLQNTVKDSGVTALHVTHNQSEVQRLADHVFHLRDGKVTQQTQ